MIAICRLLSNRAAPHLARVAGRPLGGEIREQVWEVVRQKLVGRVREVAALITTAEPQHAHEIFQVLRRSMIQTICYSPWREPWTTQPKVRLEGLTQLLSALRCCSHIGDARFIGWRQSVRSRALHSLALVRKNTVHERIMACINAPDYAQYELDEKRRFAAAAALTGGDSLRWTEQFSNPRIFRSVTKIGTVRRLLWAFDYSRTPKAFWKRGEPFAENTLVAEAARWALQHMEAERSVRTQQLHALFFRASCSSPLGRRHE